MIMNQPNGELRVFLIKWLQMLAIMVFVPCAYAQIVPSDPKPTTSFSMLGYLQELKVDHPDQPLSSGSMVINGVRVILPANLLIKMPGQYLTVNDLFRGPHPDLNLNIPENPSSGLALNDKNKPAIPFEVQVIGNIVDGKYIAGWVSISQQDLNIGAGYICDIDYSKGELLIGDKAGCGITEAARVRINDPAGRYGKKNSDKVGGAAFDERFSADPGNAPIVSQTGFPMCIPRVAPPENDELCPRHNRPLAPNSGRFTCGKTNADPTALPHQVCDPKVPAPLQIGDYISFAGMLTEDSPGASTFFHAAHSIKSMTGIYTSPGSNPAYVNIEVAILGTLGEPFKDVPQEETSRFRIVGFTTDASRRVNVFLLDVKKDVEGVQERLLTTLDPQRVGQVGRVRITLPAKANFLPVTRDVRIRIEGVERDIKVAGGLDSGQYTAPVGEYIYPENTLFGAPMFPVSVPFENFCFLRGGERLGTLGRDALDYNSRTPLGELLPFPKSGHTNPLNRTNNKPVCP
jgi:hypothetical protein